MINCVNCLCCFSGSQFLHLFAEEYYLRKYLLSQKNIWDCESSGPDPCSLVAAVTNGNGGGGHISGLQGDTPACCMLPCESWCDSDVITSVQCEN